MILGRWAPHFVKFCGGSWPDDYTCFDLETSGFSFDRDVIVEWGHCIVRDRQPTNRMGFIINWFGSGLIPDDYLDYQLRRVWREMAKVGRTFRVTPEIMRRDGVTPETGLNFIEDFLITLREGSEMLVTHNGWKFDVRMLTSHLHDFMGSDFEFDPNHIIDTGAVEKASQIESDMRALPGEGETMKDYFTRIANWVLPGVKWNLDTWCMEKYDLARKYGANTEDAHAADYDAWLLHLLMEEFRVLLAAEPPPVRDDVPIPAEPRVPKSRKKTVKKSVKEQTVTTKPRKRRRGQRNS